MTATFVEEPVLTLRGVDLLLDAKGLSCSDELMVQMKDWCNFNSCFIFIYNSFIYILTYDFCCPFHLFTRYNHEVLRPPRPQHFSGFPHVRAAEVMFIRQIQKMMFDVFYEHLSLVVMNSRFSEVRCMP